MLMNNDFRYMLRFISCQLPKSFLNEIKNTSNFK